MLKIDLSEKNILITGASAGIGQKICIDAVAGNAAAVYGVARSADRLAQTSTACGDKSGFHPLVADLTDLDRLKSFVGELPILHGIVLNAGIADFLPTRFLNHDKIGKVFDLNFESCVLLVTELQKQKKITPGASIILMSSISSKLVIAGTAMYAASKAALSAYGRVLAAELAPNRVRVNSILPGIIVTDLIQGQAVLTDEIIKKNEANYPLGLGKVGDVSGLTQFLLSDLSSWITGSEIVIDGGYSLT